MELRPGYKNSEVGFVPADWEIPELREHLLQDATYGVVTAGKFLRSGVPMLRGGDIKNGTIGAGQPLISEDKNREYSRTILRERDVVIALVGYPGESAVVPERLVGANISRAVGLLRPAKGLLPSYLACYLNSPCGRKEFLRPSAGSAQIVVNLGALNKLAIPVPLPAEQSAIATALGDVDGLLAAQDALIAKKRAIKQGAMQELLTGKRRLPGFSGEWGVRSLGNFGACYRGVSYDPTTDLFLGDAHESVRLLRANNVQDSSIDLEGLQFVRNDRVAERQSLRHGDVLICMANGSKDLVGKAARFTLADGMRYTFGAFMGCYRPDPAKVSPVFSFYLFQTDAYRLHLANLLAGSSINNLAPKSIEGLEIAIPLQDAEQDAIAEVLSDMDTEITALEASRAKTAQLKQGMMQALLTGRIRLV